MRDYYKKDNTPWDLIDDRRVTLASLCVWLGQKPFYFTTLEIAVILGISQRHVFRMRSWGMKNLEELHRVSQEDFEDIRRCGSFNKWFKQNLGDYGYDEDDEEDDDDPYF
jgi:hypothetical protein